MVNCQANKIIKGKIEKKSFKKVTKQLESTHDMKLGQSHKKKIIKAHEARGLII